MKGEKQLGFWVLGHRSAARQQLTGTAGLAPRQTSWHLPLSQAIRWARLRGSHPRGGLGGHSAVAAVPSREAAAPWGPCGCSTDSSSDQGQQGRGGECARGRSQRLPSTEL